MSRLLEGTVRAVRPKRVFVQVEEGTIEVHVRGALKGGPRRVVHLVVVGDRVTVRVGAGGELWLDEVRPRRNVISRVDPGDARGERRHDLAANLDAVVVVCSLMNPDFNPRAVDRFLVLAEISKVPSRLVLNKIDRQPDPGTPSAEELLDPYRRAGYPVHQTSATGAVGLEELRGVLAGRVSLLLGPSGAGKSSLMNALYGLSLRTGEISRATSKGIHTTTRVEWIELPGGGAVLDSPGLRSIHPAGLNRRTLAACFPELRELPPCQFTDCLHSGEAGCAVPEAIQQGLLAASRLDGYLRILEATAR